MTGAEYQALSSALRGREQLARDIVDQHIRGGMPPNNEILRSLVALHQRTLDELSELDRKFGYLP